MFISRLPAVKKVMGSILVGAHARSNLKSVFEIFINNSYYFKNDNNNNNIVIIIITTIIIIIIFIIIIIMIIIIMNAPRSGAERFSVKSIIFFCAFVYISLLVYNFMFSFPQFSCRAWFTGCVRLSSTPGL